MWLGLVPIYYSKINVIFILIYKDTIHTDEAVKNWVTHGFKFVAKDTI